MKNQINTETQTIHLIEYCRKRQPFLEWQWKPSALEIFRANRWNYRRLSNHKFQMLWILTISYVFRVIFMGNASYDCFAITNLFPGFHLFIFFFFGICNKLHSSFFTIKTNVWIVGCRNVSLEMLLVKQFQTDTAVTLN